MHDEAMAGIKKHLLATTPTGGYVYTTELGPRRDQSGQMYARPPDDLTVLKLGTDPFLLEFAACSSLGRSRTTSSPSSARRS